MKFEKEFPNLPIFGFEKCGCCGNETEKGREFIPKENVKKYCIDKQRVRNAIEKVYKSRKYTSNAGWMDFANKLEKELGL